MPAEEDDLFAKLTAKGVLTAGMGATLKTMKGFRNILVHRYAEVDDELVFEFLGTRLGDFEQFKKQVLNFLENYAP